MYPSAGCIVIGHGHVREWDVLFTLLCDTEAVQDSATCWNVNTASPQ